MPHLWRAFATGRDLKFSSLYPIQYPVVDRGTAHFPDRFLVKCYMTVGWAASLPGISLDQEVGSVQVSTWHNECLDLGWACMVCCYSPPFLRLHHLINNWICLPLCNFGQMFPLFLFLPYSTVHTYSSGSTLGAWVHEEAHVRGMMLSAPHTQLWMLWKTSWLLFPRLFWGEVEKWPAI